MSRIFQLTPAVLLFALLAGCAWVPGAKKRRIIAAETALVASRRAPSPVGRVALVNREERFALIETTLAQTPAAGTVLRSYSGGSVSAEFRVSEVRRRPFFVADLVSGIPSRGDLVVRPGAFEEMPRAQAVEPPKPLPKPLWRRWLGFLGRGE